MHLFFRPCRNYQERNQFSNTSNRFVRQSCEHYRNSLFRWQLEKNRRQRNEKLTKRLNRTTDCIAPVTFKHVSKRCTGTRNIAKCSNLFRCRRHQLKEQRIENRMQKKQRTEKFSVSGLCYRVQPINLNSGIYHLTKNRETDEHERNRERKTHSHTYILQTLTAVGAPKPNAHSRRNLRL